MTRMLTMRQLSILAVVAHIRVTERPIMAAYLVADPVTTHT